MQDLLLALLFIVGVVLGSAWQHGRQERLQRQPQRQHDPAFNTFWGGFFNLSKIFVIGWLIGIPLVFFLIPLAFSLR